MNKGGLRLSPASRPCSSVTPPLRTETAPFSALARPSACGDGTDSTATRAAAASCVHPLAAMPGAPPRTVRPAASCAESSPADSECASCCMICYESHPPPSRSGCACRGDAGLVHPRCLVRNAVAQEALRGSRAWWECQTCHQDLTGTTRWELAAVQWSRAQGLPEESAAWLAAAQNLGKCHLARAEYAEAERMLRHVHAVSSRTLGAEDPATLTDACELSFALLCLGKCDDASNIAHTCSEASRRLFGDEDLLSLRSAQLLAISMAMRGDLAGGGQLLREVHTTCTRVLGETDMLTMNSGAMLCRTLSEQGEYALVEPMLRTLYRLQRRVLGEDHPEVVICANNLGMLLANLGKYDEAASVLQAAFTRCQRNLGDGHPSSRAIARRLGHILALRHSDEGSAGSLRLKNSS